jgi:hypothetical protein
MARSNIEMLNMVIERILSKVNTSLPAKITKYDYTKQKASVQPLIDYISLEGKEIKLPIINSVPVIFQSSGGASMTFPVKEGDNVLLLFCQRSLENWLKDGQQRVPDDPRIYDLTDAVAITGLNPFSVTSPASNNEDAEWKYAGSNITIKKSGEILLSTNTNSSINIKESGDISLSTADGKLIEITTAGIIINSAASKFILSNSQEGLKSLMDQLIALLQNFISVDNPASPTITVRPNNGTQAAITALQTNINKLIQ